MSINIAREDIILCKILNIIIVVNINCFLYISQ